jgi:predicted unusual protein kinase regulating ubiquinone biosynthesis (AarF/ABC1/UbiB family)
MEGDTKLIELFVDIAERIFVGFKYKWLAEELRVNLPKELDFKGEVRNAKEVK